MNRAQRNAHRIVFWVLGPLLVAVVVWAVVDRWVYPDQPPIEASR